MNIQNMLTEIELIDKAGLANIYVPVNRLKVLLAVVEAATNVYYNHLLPDEHVTWSTDAADLKDALAALGGQQ